jgi:hypothetical protein
VTDLFNEVEEELRAERLKTVAQKAAPWILGLVALILLAVGGYYGWRSYDQQTTAKASDAYGQGLEALVAGRKADADRLFGQVATSNAKAYKALALMQQGGLRMSDGKAREAAALFDKAAEAAPDEIIGDAARLKAAFAVMGSASFKEVELRLKPLTETERPYAVQAREALAFAKLAAGDLAGARGDFVVLSLLPGASEAAQGRAEAAKQLIDSGSAKATPDVIKAIAALPPTGPETPPAPQPQAPGAQ